MAKRNKSMKKKHSAADEKDFALRSKLSNLRAKLIKCTHEDGIAKYSRMIHEVENQLRASK